MLNNAMNKAKETGKKLSGFLKSVFKQKALCTETVLNTNKINKRYLASACVFAVCLMAMPAAVAADASPLDAINNMADLVFSIIKAVGVILAGFGVLQLGISLSSHDASQRATGLLCMGGGVIVFLAKEILTFIGVSV